MTPLGWTKGLLHQYSVNSISLARKKTRPHTPEKLRMAVGQTGEEKACFLKYVCWSTERNTGRFFTWLQASWSLRHLPVMDGHMGWEDGALCHPEGFLHAPVILAEIRDRPQQKWTPRLLPQWESGGGHGVSQALQVQRNTCVLPAVAPQGFHWTESQLTFSRQPARPPTTWPQCPSSTLSRAPMPAHTSQLHSLWSRFGSCSSSVTGCSFLRLCWWGWARPWDTLSKHFPQLVPPCHRCPRTSVHRSSLATFSDVAFPPHPSRFLMLFSSPHCIIELLLLVCLLFLVSFLYSGWKLDENRELNSPFWRVGQHRRLGT